jgi:hypothetical protein
MKIISSYGIEIKQMNKIFRPTVAIYNDAISFCIDAFENEWSDIEGLDTMQRKQYAESLIHSTRNNTAKYGNFDTLFHKMPSYMRRAVINTALGYLSSYHSNLDNWYYNKCQGNPPTLQRHLNKFPTFYKDNMYSECDGDTVKLKIYKDNDWKWIDVKLKHTDMQYIRKHLSGVKMSVPTLEKKHHRGTSKLAYDGSGTVLRGKDAGFNTYELCKFSNGKIYNCDLSASYNIGARYFIRELEKSISVKKWSLIQAKVPECAKRTQCTYNTLVKILKVA